MVGGVAECDRRGDQPTGFQAGRELAAVASPADQRLQALLDRLVARCVCIRATARMTECRLFGQQCSGCGKEAAERLGGRADFTAGNSYVPALRPAAARYASGSPRAVSPVSVADSSTTGTPISPSHSSNRVSSACVNAS
jgi:hypothetical protein